MIKCCTKVCLVFPCFLGVLAAWPVQGATVFVDMINIQFIPKDLTIAFGDTVTWTNIEFTAHDTVSGMNGVPSGLWRSPLFNFGGRFSFTFTNTPIGVKIPYYCTPHWRTFGMIGSITVLPPPPTIVNPTNGESFLAGDNVVIQATPPGVGNVARMDFFTNGVAVGSITNPPYNVTLTNIAPGNFALSAVTVNAQGISSAPATVNIAVGIPEPPTIVTQPQGGTNKLGSSFQLAVVATAKPPPRYKWWFNGAEIPGATNSTYLIDPVRTSDAGEYSVTVFNVFGGGIHFLASSNVLLVVDHVPPTVSITNSPPDFTRTNSPMMFLSGTAADDLALGSVQLQINSGPLLDVAGEPLTAEGTTRWSATVALQPGNNAVRVRSIDVAGNVSLEVIRFITYDPAANGQGSYSGLFYDTKAPALESSGIFFLKVANRGSFSGKLFTQGKSFPFRGQFDGQLHATVTLLRGASRPLGLNVQLDPYTGRVFGQVTNDLWTADLLGHLNEFRSKSNPAIQTGPYDFRFLRDDNLTVVESNLVASITSAGKVRFRGSFDGRKVSFATTLSEAGDAPFYVLVNPGNEAVFGWLRFPVAATNNYGTNLFWIRSGADSFIFRLDAISGSP